MYSFWNCKKENETFGIRLKKLRKYKNLSQVQLAKDLCVSRSCISNYERGYRYPDYEMIKRIAEYFGVLIDYLAAASDFHDFPIRKDKISGKFIVVSSCEEVKNDSNVLGSLVTVPAVAGIYLASYIINAIIE